MKIRTDKNTRNLHKNILLRSEFPYLKKEVKEFLLNLIEDAHDYEQEINKLKISTKEFFTKTTQIKHESNNYIHLRYTFSSGIKNRLKDLDMSQVSLSATCNLSTKSICEILDFNRNITINNIEKIAESLGCTALDLIKLGEI